MLAVTRISCCSTCTTVSLHGHAQPLGNFKCGGERTVRQHDGKLLAADAPDIVRRPQPGFERSDDALQHEIADRVTVAVVDRLEMIDVEYQAAQLAVAAPLPRHVTVRRIEKSAAAHGAREIVGGRQQPQLELIDHQAREVLEDLDRPSLNWRGFRSIALQRADVVAILGAQRNADVIADVWLADHHRQRGKPLVQCGVADDQRSIFPDRVGAEGIGARVCRAFMPWFDLNHWRSRSTSETSTIGIFKTDFARRVMRSNCSSGGVSRTSYPWSASKPSLFVKGAFSHGELRLVQARGPTARAVCP